MLRTDNERVGEVLKGLADFVDAVVLPLESENHTLLSDPRKRYSESGKYSPDVLELRRDVRRRSAAAGFYTMCVPEELGGGGQGPLLHFLAWELLFRRYGPEAVLPGQVLAHWAQGPSGIFSHASASVRENVLPGLMTGDSTVCFSLSEPDAGSDAWNLRTRAVLTGEIWTLNGTKQWSTNGSCADHALVFAVTDPELAKSRAGGITCFLVPADTPGFRVDSTIRMFGSVGGEEAIISLSDVQVPSDQLLGDLHQGFKVALEGISLGRMFNAGRAVGMSRWALDRATEYAGQRRTFGKAISEHQAVQFLLADSAIDIYAARSMALDCADKLESGKSARKELAMVKAFATESSFRVLDNCIQVFGAMGVTSELGLFEGWHQARTSRIADGSGEIMRRTIARQLLRGDSGF